MSEILKGKKILLGVTASIAAYKTPALVREFIKLGAEVKVIMTPSSEKFVSPMILSNLSLNSVITDMFDKSVMDEGAWHIHSAHWADIMLIAPCSASTLGKIANGICDNALCAVTFALSDEAPLVISPAMDTNMWTHPATQRNAKQAEADGAYIIKPAEGPLSSGLIGPGRFPEFSVIVESLRNALRNKEELIERKKKASLISPEYPRYGVEDQSKHSANASDEIKVEFVKKESTIDDIKLNTELDLEKLKIKLNLSDDLSTFYKGKKLLINAGPTYEKIDDVRFIGNYSSGKMGYAIAKAAEKLGAIVTLVSGPVSLTSPAGVTRINVESAFEMRDEVVYAFRENDIAILSAAVADFAPETRYEGKIKKQAAVDTMDLKLIKTPDILAELGKLKNNKQFICGFALESSNEVENAKTKLKNKNADMIVLNSANQPDSGFKGDNNTITIIDKFGEIKEYDTASKDVCAMFILQAICDKHSKWSK
jgi:phosphopantothenoylcysteine decarboxylase/phosphopantothenate--cysteine ligase